MRAMRHFLNRLSFHVFGGVCILCDRTTRRAFDLCEACERDLPSILRRCECCSLPLDSLEHCQSCTTTPFAFDTAYCHFVYRTPVDRLISDFKTRGRQIYGHVLAECAASGWSSYARSRPEVLIPVPLTRRKRRQRGFNQADEVASVLGSRLGLPVRRDLARRRFEVDAQKGLGRDARQRNLRGVFGINGQVQGCHLAIVDDVVTTGATASELARALKQAGARQVDVVGLARTPQRDLRSEPAGPSR